jgi:hypothetical protein
MRVTVEYSCKEPGVLTLDEGRLRFPSTPDLPSVYRFDLSVASGYSIRVVRATARRMWIALTRAASAAPGLSTTPCALRVP